MSRCKACDRLLTDTDNDKLCHFCNKVSIKTTIDNDYDGEELELYDIIDEIELDT